MSWNHDSPDISRCLLRMTRRGQETAAFLLCATIIQRATHAYSKNKLVFSSTHWTVVKTRQRLSTGTRCTAAQRSTSEAYLNVKEHQNFVWSQGVRSAKCTVVELDFLHKRRSKSVHRVFWRRWARLFLEIRVVIHQVATVMCGFGFDLSTVVVNRLRWHCLRWWCRSHQFRHRKSD